MDRLCPTTLFILLLAGASSGCTGQNLEGAWRGPFPFDGANDCRIRMTNARRFDLSCREDPAWVGVGDYERDGNHLRMKFSTLSRRGEVVASPPTVDIEFLGAGNSLQINPSSPSKAVWRRLPP